MSEEMIKAGDLNVPNDGGRVYLLAFPATFQSSSFDFIRWLQMATRAWAVLAVGLIVGAFGGYAASFLSRIEYSAETIVLVVEHGSSNGLLGSVLSEFGARSAATALGMTARENLKSEALAYLNSAEFAQSVIAKHRLLGDLFPTEWDPETGDWREPAQAPTMNEAIKKFRERHFASVDNRSAGTIAVSFVSPRRESLAIVVNGMIADINTAMRDRAIAEADRSIAYLNQQVNVAATIEIRELISRLLESQYSRRMLAHAREDYAFRIVDPARVPDADQKIAPRRSLWAAMGAFLGFGLTFAFVLYQARQISARPKAP